MAYLKEHEDHVVAHGGFSAAVVEMKNYQGEIQIEACTECDHMEVTCLHLSNTWNEEGTVLTCDLCGADVT